MKNTDMRITKTKTALAEALLELLDKRPFEDIKVVDICERAYVHRTTFYKHFEDKYQLLDYVIDEIINELAASLDTIEGETSPEVFFASLLKNIIEYVHLRRHKFRLVIKNNAYGSFMQTMQRAIYEHILKYLHELEKRGYDFSVPPEIIASYRSGGLISTAYFFLSRNNKYTTEEIYSFVTQLSFAMPLKRKEL